MEGNFTGIARKLANIEEKIKEISKQIQKLDDDIFQQRLDDGFNEEAEDTINKKIQDINSRIKGIRDQIKTKRTEIQSINTDTEGTGERKYRLQEEIDGLQEEIYQLQEKKDGLQEEKNLLQQQIITLERQIRELQQRKDDLRQQIITLRQQKELLKDQFGKGEYYAFTNAYWKFENVRRDGGEWDSFVRNFAVDEYERFHCRYARTTNADISHKNPYATTRQGAFNETYTAAPANTTCSSSMPQSERPARNAVWPTDIFGNESSAQIAHLLPAGTLSHKHWLNVACAVLGIKRSAAINVKKKAVAGCRKKTENFDPSTQQQGVARASDASNRSVEDSATKKASPRQPGTGVVHFVANKIRLQDQANSLDGGTPTCLIVPVMTLQDALNWRGESYRAICFAGVPENSAYQVLNNGGLYVRIGLTPATLMEVEHPRDAKNDEVEKARALLEKAVLALHDMIAGLSGEELKFADPNSPVGKALKDARTEAQNMGCRVPRSVETSIFERKPACLITFGGFCETNMHPAPDPLLLVLRAANTFGIMAGMKMLASASPKDSDDISIDDIMEEEAFLEAREQSFRPKTWDDLAKGLGQPNGYFTCIGEPTDIISGQ